MNDLVKHVSALKIKVPKDAMAALEKLNRRINVPTRGIEGAGETQYRPELLRLYQRTTTDEGAPEGCVPGDVYAGGRILHKGKGGDGVLVVPFLGWIGHQRWPNAAPRPDCSSQDGKYSVTGIKCTDCDDEPWKHGNRTNCQRVLHFYMLALDLSDIYYVNFRSSSYKAGRNIVTTMEKRDSVWDATWRLTTAMQQGDLGQYNVWKTTVVNEPPVPEHTKALAEVLNAGFGDKRRAMLTEMRERREAIAAHTTSEAPPIDVSGAGESDLDDDM